MPMHRAHFRYIPQYPWSYLHWVTKESKIWKPGHCITVLAPVSGPSKKIGGLPTTL